MSANPSDMIPRQIDIKEWVDYLSKQISDHPLVTTTVALLAQTFPVEKPQILAISALMVFDFITGVIAAKARGDLITSRKGYMMTFRKVMSHLILVLGSAATVPLIQTTVIFQGVMGMIAAWELLSIWENLFDSGWTKLNPRDAGFLQKFIKGIKEGGVSVTVSAGTPVNQIGSSPETPASPAAGAPDAPQEG